MRWLLVFMLLASPAAFAGDLERVTTMLFYWERPLDAEAKKDARSSFGLRIDNGRAAYEPHVGRPLVDLRFNERGFRLFAFRGSALLRNQAASEGPAPEINWWLVGGIAAGAAIVVRAENRKDPESGVRRGTGRVITSN